MPITRVAGAQTSQDLNPAGSTTTGIDTRNSDLLVINSCWFDTNQPSLADNQGNTGALSGGPGATAFIRNDSFFGTANDDSYYLLGPGTAVSHTFTSNTGRSAVSVAGFSGVKQAGGLDQQNGKGGSGLGSSIQTAAGITPSVNDCLIVVTIYFESGTVHDVTDATYGAFTIESQVTGASGSAIASKIITGGSGVNVNPTVTFSGSQTRSAMGLFSFKPEPVADLAVRVGEPVTGSSAIN